MIQRIACFVSPHGFGHATRTIAVLQALRQRCPEITVEIYTTVPEYLFAASLAKYTYHPVVTDVGLVQNDALHVDIPATIEQLDRLLPFDQVLLEELAGRIRGCNCVLCDIAPLGIAVAKKAKVPSILLENFTWDWIYQPYWAEYPELRQHGESLRELFSRVTYHIQTEPVCNRGPADLHCSPISRRAKKPPELTRRNLAIADRKLVVISLGGILTATPHWHTLQDHDDCYFVLAGQEKTSTLSENVLLLARDSEIYHPDLIQAADLVLCKSGYSTIAECCQAGCRIACIGRTIFPESAVLADFVTNRLNGTIIDIDTFANGEWLSQLADLLTRPRPKPFSANGAQAAASFIAAL